MGINVNNTPEAALYQGTKFPKKDVRNATEVDVSVGKELKDLRKKAGMTQTMLAEQVGVTFQQIQKYERGANRIGASRLWAFCQVFSVKPDRFFQGLETDFG